MAEVRDAYSDAYSDAHADARADAYAYADAVFSRQLLGSYPSRTYRGDGSRRSGTRFLFRVLEVAENERAEGERTEERSC
jgi:hypothetical protein